MAPKRCDSRIETLIVRLRDSEHMTFEKIAEHIGNLTKKGVWKIYQRMKHPVPLKKGGKPRVTDPRCDFNFPTT